MKFTVTGFALVPVKVRIRIDADNADAAMKAASQRLKTGIRDYIIPGTEDHAAAFGFDASDADPLPQPAN